MSGPDGVSEVVWDPRAEKLIERQMHRVKVGAGTRMTGHHLAG